MGNFQNKQKLILKEMKQELSRKMSERVILFLCDDKSTGSRTKFIDEIVAEYQYGSKDDFVSISYNFKSFVVTEKICSSIHNKYHSNNYKYLELFNNDKNCGKLEFDKLDIPSLPEMEKYVDQKKYYDIDKKINLIITGFIRFYIISNELEDVCMMVTSYYKKPSIKVNKIRIKNYIFDLWELPIYDILNWFKCYPLATSIIFIADYPFDDKSETLFRSVCNSLNEYINSKHSLFIPFVMLCLNFDKLENTSLPRYELEQYIDEFKTDELHIFIYCTQCNNNENIQKIFKDIQTRIHGKSQMMYIG